MCGIAGLWRFGSASEPDLLSQVRAMSAAVESRGPDDDGYWCDPTAGISLAHRRLAILDLSNSGHQPMHSASGRYIMVFNGEIYNHLKLRLELEQTGNLLRPWRGSSDTETLLSAIEAWGLEPTLQRCVGMFAIALWDKCSQSLSLARDRFGEKPLYWGISGSGNDRALLFGSDLKSLRSWSGFNNPISRSALAQFLRFNCLSAPTSIYSGIQHLPPGHLVTIDSPRFSETVQSSPWWCFRSMLSNSISNPFAHTELALDELEAALVASIKLQSIADVPLGSFLSGGIDSALVTALLQSVNSRPIRTFTIGFEDPSFNEAPFARELASYLGTDHFETVLTTSDAQSLIPQLASIYSEPFADSSQIPTHLVCREARRSGLTVALTGDGGDELFGGYNRYLLGARIWPRLSSIPWPLRRLLGNLLLTLPPEGWDALGQPLRIQQLGHKAHKLGSRLEHVRSSDDLYRSLVSHWSDPATLLQPSDATPILEPASPLDWPLPAFLSSDSVARMMATDTLNYLPNDILTKVDRASMASSLETRAPFLDHRVAEVAWRLPFSMKIHSYKSKDITKWALRQLLYRRVPRELIERPKAGFSVPIGTWLRHPLRSWAEDLLDPDLMKQQGYIRPEPVQALWQQHLSGRFDHTAKIWTVLMWQAWLSEWG